MKIINVIQSIDNDILNIDSFPVYCEQTSEPRKSAEELCCKLVFEHLKSMGFLNDPLLNEDNKVDFENYFFEDICEDVTGYKITIINSYIDE